MTKEEKQDWESLYNYVKIDVMGYTNKVFPKNFILRLQGLMKGQFIANKNSATHASYSAKVVLLTFKLCKAKINDYFARHASSFESEQHKFYGAMRIVESEINNTVALIERKSRAAEKTDAIDMSHQCIEQAEYKPRGKITTNHKLKGLL